MKPDRVRGVIFAMAMVSFYFLSVFQTGFLPKFENSNRGGVKKDAPVPRLLGRERNRFVVPPKFETQSVSFGLLLRGEGRGRFRPRSAAVLRLS